MSVSDKAGGVTPADVSKELDDLEVSYKSRRKHLRALLAVLEDEADGETKETTDDRAAAGDVGGAGRPGKGDADNDAA